MTSRSRRLLPALVLAAQAAGCGALDPYPTAPQVVSGSAPAVPRVAICYNTLKTPLAEVQQQAQQECASEHPGTVAQPAETDWYLQNCPLLLPERATFYCASRR